MTQSFEMTFSSETMRPFEAESASRLIKGPFLPVTFVRRSGGSGTVTAVYDCSGYVPVSCRLLDRVREGLDIAEGLAAALKKVDETLIDPDTLSLDIATAVFVKSGGTEVRLAYIPGPTQCLKPGERRAELSGFFEAMAAITPNRDLRSYLTRLKESADAGGSPGELIDMCGRFKREAHMCGVV